MQVAAFLADRIELVKDQHARFRAHEVEQPAQALRRFGALLRAAGAKRTIARTRRARPWNAASVRAGTWRFSEGSPLSLPNPRRLGLVGSLCYIRPGDVQRRCPFLARPSEAR